MMILGSVERFLSFATVGFRHFCAPPSLLNTYIINCLWIPQTAPDSANFVADSAKLPVFDLLRNRPTIHKIHNLALQ